ncbi:hypothetical protein RR48_05973 [Papilio machaon]|uniref:Uncharacterized protein n=1 Tax=Papilio machaon TaxID=76193 RepID=A0A0N0PEQ0_PAPMA|nr:hypothetical protein RR48_05973 [Papilio machaon]
MSAVSNVTKLGPSLPIPIKLNHSFAGPMSNEVDALALCFVCKKHVQNAECLIEKILNNQILVNLHNFSDQTIDVMVQPYFNIAVLDTIELSSIDVQTEEATIVYKHGVYKECMVKNEMKCEFEDYLQNDNDFIDIKVDIKNELSDIAECDTDINEVKILKKTVKKKKGINKGRKRKAAVVTNGMEERNCQIDNDVNSINVMDLFKELETKEALEKSKLKKSIAAAHAIRICRNGRQHYFAVLICSDTSLGMKRGRKGKGAWGAFPPGLKSYDGGKLLDAEDRILLKA